MTQPADWSQVMHDALGADAEGGFKARPSVILQNPWVELSGAHWEEGQGASPWNYAMPGGDWNMVTFYRKRTTPSPSGHGQSYKFQVFRGFIRFYDGGASSAAQQAQQFVRLSQTAVDGVNQNPHLDAQSFRAASDLFFNVMWWLENDGEARLRSMANDIDTEGSDFNGTAAAAFAWALRDMRQAMIELRYAISGNGAPSWPDQLDQNAAAIDTFKSAVSNAWSAFTAFVFYDPNWMIDYVVHEMERQVDQYDHDYRWGASSDWGAEWDFTFPNLESPGPFNLMSKEGWNALSAGMQNSWRTRTDALSLAAVNAMQALSDTLQSTLDSMKRPVTPHQPMPWPGAGDVPGDPGAGGDVPGGTGAGGDVPGGTGAGGDVPGGTGAGGDVPGGTGAGGDVPGGTGAGGDVPGGTGAGGDVPGGTGAGGDVPGGTGAGGDVPGGTGAGGDVPGGTGAGGDVPGGTGAGGDVPGGTGAGGDIPGGTGAGGNVPGGAGDIPGGAGDAGGGAGDAGAGAIPGLGMGGVLGGGSGGAGAGSDPNSRRGSSLGGLDNQPGSDSVGGGVIGGLDNQPNSSSGAGSLIGGLSDQQGAALQSPTPLSPTGLDGGGFTRLSPDNNAGISIGPLGNPPAGYTGAGPLPGVPGGAGTRALAGGSYGPDGAVGLGGLAPGAQGGLAQGGVNGSVGTNGSGSYPFIPPMMGGMGGLGGQASEKERERTTWLAEDEEVWGTDPDCVPAVIGREEVPDTVRGEPTERPSRPRDPARPQQPVRTGQNRAGRRDT